MKFKEFREQCSLFNTCKIRHANHHVIVHYSAFETFYRLLLEGIVTEVAECSKFWKKDHVHLFVRSSKWKNVWGIRGEFFQNKQHRKYIIVNFFHCKETRHNFMCHFELGIHSLMDMSLLIILQNLQNFRDIFKLGLPKFIIDYIIERCETLYQLPINTKKSYGGIDKTFAKVKYIYESHMYDKDWIVWLQNQHKIQLLKPSVMIYSVCFQNADNTIIKRCSVCMNSKPATRVVKYRNRWDLKSILKDPTEWCHVCKQVPLFVLIPDRYISLAFWHKDWIPIKDESIIKIMLNMFSSYL